MSESEDVHAYTVRLELTDRPGELLRALEPIAETGGNLLSIFHERGNLTPRGDIPVEVDLEATPERFEQIVDALKAADITVIEAGSDRYSEEIVVVLVGHLVETDLSHTLSQIQEASGASIKDFALSAPEGENAESSARLRMATEAGKSEQILAAIREIAGDKELSVIEPLGEVDR